MNHQSLSAFIWSVADLLRGDYKQSDYGKVILPFTVLRRLDCVLATTKPAVLAEFEKRSGEGLNPEPFLLRAAGQSFYNTSRMDMARLIGDADHIAQNLYAYIQAFSPAVRDIFERFEFIGQVDRLARSRSDLPGTAQPPASLLRALDLPCRAYRSLAGAISRPVDQRHGVGRAVPIRARRV
jgi:type I restriction enzyme M protein